MAGRGYRSEVLDESSLAPRELDNDKFLHRPSRRSVALGADRITIASTFPLFLTHSILLLATYLSSKHEFLHPHRQFLLRSLSQASFLLVLDGLGPS